MWARVTYLIDKQSADVPLTYFKNSEEVAREWESGKCRDTYRVFWSEKETDNPEKILKEQGRVLDVDRIIRSNARGNGRGPLTGYYVAKLDNYAENLEELLEKVNAPENRGPPAAEENDSSTSIKHGKSKEEAAILSQKARVYNLAVFSHDNSVTDNDIEASDVKKKDSKRTSPFKSPPVKRVKSFPMDYLEESEIKVLLNEKNKLVECLKEENENLKLKYTLLKGELKDKEEKIETLLKLNIYWQEQEMKRQKYKFSESSHERSHSFSHGNSFEEEKKQSLKNNGSVNSKPGSNHREGDETEENISQVKPATSKGMGEINLDTIIFDGDIPMVEENASSTEYEIVHIEPSPAEFLFAPSLHANEEDIPNKPPTSGAVYDEENLVRRVSPINQIIQGAVKNPDPQGAAFFLVPPPKVSAVSQSQFDSANKRTPGKKGDSNFVKKLADMVWTREQLFNRSACGLPQPNEPNALARPACSPNKKKYLTMLLKKRIALELQPGDSLTNSSSEKRIKDFNRYLSSKIKTIRAGVIKGNLIKQLTSLRNDGEEDDEDQDPDY